MNKLISFYKSQKQHFWTHILLPFTFTYWGYIIYGISIYWIYGKIVDILPLYFWFIGLCIFSIGLLIALISIIINLFLKKKIKNKFLLENKLYGIIWHTGNILLGLLIILHIYIILIFICSKLMYP